MIKLDQENPHTATGQERQREIIGATFNLIAQKGIEGLRIRDVAGVVGINNATLHYYFPSKEALIRSVVEDFIRQFAPFYTRVQAPTLTDPTEQLREHFALLKEQIVQMPERFRVMNELYLYAQRDPAVYTLLKQADADWQAMLAALFQAGRGQGAFRADLDPAHAAWSVTAFCKGICLVLNADANDLAATIDSFWQSFLTAK